MATPQPALQELRKLHEGGVFRLDAADAMEAVLEALPSRTDPQVRNYVFTEETLRFEIVSTSTTQEVARGDVVEAGIGLAYSTRREVQIVSYFSRLTCRNDLRHRPCGGPIILASTNEKARAQQLEDVALTARTAWQSLPDKLGATRELTSLRVSVPDFLERYLREAGLPARLPRLLQAWHEDGSTGTEWGALNALTRVATHDENLPPLERQRLARLAGALAFRREHLCGRCMPRGPHIVRRLGAGALEFVMAGLQPTTKRELSSLRQGGRDE